MNGYLKYRFKRCIAWEALASAGASLAGAGITAGGQSSLNKKTREFNAEQAELQRAWNESMYNKQNEFTVAMWNAENQYNSPAAQVQRMQEAGLNPLYYGLDGSSAEGVSSAQPLGYERASVGNQVNPLSSFQDSAMRAAQITAMELENQKKQKELDWYDKEHQQEFDFKAASIDEITHRIEKIDNEVRNGEMDIQLKQRDMSKKEAETAVEWAKYASYGLDNQLKMQLNPLVVRAQELENQLAETKNQYEAERILAELAETRAHTAALYAQAALDGAQKEGVQIKNKLEKANLPYAGENAKNRANLLKWTSTAQGYQSSILKNTWKGKVSIDNYYAEHYEEAFRNSWSKSGVEYGITEKIADGLGTAALMGLLLAF